MCMVVYNKLHFVICFCFLFFFSLMKLCLLVFFPEIINGFVSNAMSMAMKSLWSLKTTTKTGTDLWLVCVFFFPVFFQFCFGSDLVVCVYVYTYIWKIYVCIWMWIHLTWCSDYWSSVDEVWEWIYCGDCVWWKQAWNWTSLCWSSAQWGASHSGLCQ